MTATAATGPALGLFCILLAAVALLLGSASLRSKPFYAVILVLAATRFVFGGLYEMNEAGVRQQL